MNFRPLFVCAAVAFAAAAHAQEAAAPVRVKVDDIKTTLIQTPQFQVSNIPAKPYRPKNWLLLETSFEAVKVKPDPNTSPDVGELEFKYYIALNKVSKTGKYPLLTGTIYYVNIIAREKSHAIAFVSPSALSRLLDNANVTIGDIKAVGVEVNYGGQATGGGKSTSGKFWDKLDSFDVTDGSILPKSKTPFAPVWGDYDVESKAQ
jgi:hypothetical protein